MTERVTARMKIEALIAESQDKVFLTREFAGLGSKDQVTRAVRALVRDHQLVRMGHGVYARAFTSRLSGDPGLHRAGVRCPAGGVSGGLYRPVASRYAGPQHRSRANWRMIADKRLEHPAGHMHHTRYVATSMPQRSSLFRVELMLRSPP